MCPKADIDSHTHIHATRSAECHTVTDQGHHEDIDQKPEEPTFNGEAYWTEGIRNPGWLTVAGTWLTYFVCAGTTSSWGVFQAEYTKMFSNEVAVSFIGSTALSIEMLGILTTPLIRRIGVRYTMLVGALICTVTLVLATFSKELWQLFATQGLMYGIGLCLVFSSPATLPSQWFVKNRALVNGIAWSGATVGPMVSANAFQALLTTLGRQITLAVMAGVICILLLMAGILSRPRYPVHSSNKVTKGDKTGSEECTKESLWSMPFMVILFFSFTYPFHWQAVFLLAPSYAQYVGASPSLAASTVTIIFGIATISRIVFGFVSDRCGRLNVLSIALSINVIFIMTLWRYADTIPMFIAFCGLLGIWGSLCPNMRPVIVSDLVGMKKAQKAICLSYLFSVPSTMVGDPFISYIHSRYGWTAAIQTIGLFGALSAIAILTVRFLTDKRLLAVV